MSASSGRSEYTPRTYECMEGIDAIDFTHLVLLPPHEDDVGAVMQWAGHLLKTAQYVLDNAPPRDRWAFWARVRLPGSYDVVEAVFTVKYGEYECSYTLCLHNVYRLYGSLKNHVLYMETDIGHRQEIMGVATRLEEPDVGRVIRYGAEVPICGSSFPVLLDENQR